MIDAAAAQLTMITIADMTGDPAALPARYWGRCETCRVKSVVTGNDAEVYAWFAAHQREAHRRGPAAEQCAAAPTAGAFLDLMARMMPTPVPAAPSKPPAAPVRAVVTVLAPRGKSWRVRLACGHEKTVPWGQRQVRCAPCLRSGQP